MCVKETINARFYDEKMRKIILLIGILLIGCTRIEYINNTIIINNTIETIKEVKIPCNLTYPDRLELIRRLKFLENQQNKWIINETECIVHNKTEEDLKNCENKIEMYERDIEELEDELDNCTDRLCEYNSSWC